jgi:hypothetical protein
MTYSRALLFRSVFIASVLAHAEGCGAPKGTPLVRGRRIALMPAFAERWTIPVAVGMIRGKFFGPVSTLRGGWNDLS